ncbi:acyltransferase [Pseudoalteromonas phenolica]|uniref:Acyltransferase n=1 Tax=Pseudoalteromonas phenolica TaxID=161398 RepID=A0A5R9Q3G1_9GAMM|nr:acyltransferase [Pseudoalteromonas phenolica]TLX47152.1 acyltransferase [Pseudoalteromonas phenolica]
MQIRRLNTIRALAAIIVLITHFSDKTDWLGGILGGRAGQYGVMLFFMLSGFLMAYLYADKPFNRVKVKAYLMARIARVLPLYLLVVLVSFGTIQLGFQSLYDIPDSSALLSHLLFIKGDSVLWTIAPEIHFYLLFVLLWGIAQWRFGYVHLLVFTCLIGLFLFNFPRPIGQLFELAYDLHIFRSLPYFIVGVLFGLHYGKAHIPEYLKSHGFVLMLGGIVLLYPDLSPVRFDSVYRMWLSYEVLLMMSAIFFALVYLVPDKNVILENKLGDFFGKISFSLYLLHMPILAQVVKLEISILMQLWVFIGLSVLAATLSYQLFERPVAKLIRGGEKYPNYR